MADLEIANNCINNSENTDKSSMANEIVIKLNCSPFTAYKYLNNALELYGHLEYPGMATNKVFALRKMYAKVGQLETKIKIIGEESFKNPNNRDGFFVVEYEKLIQKYRNDINKIEGNYIQEVKGFDIELWSRPKILITNDDRALRINKAILEKLGKEQIEDISFEDLKDLTE